MKLTDVLSGMRRLLPLLVFLVGGNTAPGTAQETEDVAIKFNPSDFLPLKVGNRWTFTHEYLNDMYFARDSLWPDIANANQQEYWEPYFKQYEIPGYPMDGESYPSDSLARPEVAVLSVEITHTEWIDGVEYFVFSEPSYSWPPLPIFFFAGQKVRLSEDGILLFHRSHVGIPLYDFSRPSRSHYL